jgi:hypothetical protein
MHALAHNVPVPPGRDLIVALERALATMPQVDCPVEHFFVDGVYVRQITVPAGICLVGYVHRFPCVTTVSKGKILINDGSGVVVVTAPYTAMCAAGSKKAGYALEDTVWCDAYANHDNETDIPTLEARLTADDHADYLRRLT